MEQRPAAAGIQLADWSLRQAQEEGGAAVCLRTVWHQPVPQQLPEPTFPIWLKSFLSNSSMVFQPSSNYGPFCVFPAIITP